MAFSSTTCYNVLTYIWALSENGPGPKKQDAFYTKLTFHSLHRFLYLPPSSTGQSIGTVEPDRQRYTQERGRGKSKSLIAYSARAAALDFAIANESAGWTGETSQPVSRASCARRFLLLACCSLQSVSDRE